jgi:hypothetical protein
MGKMDSSKTRAVPIFNLLYASDKTGNGWLPTLLRLPIGGHRITLSSKIDLTITDVGWGENEKKLEPPVSLLSWLIRHPRIPINGSLSSDQIKAQKRLDLIQGSNNRLHEALNLLRNNPRGEDWHLFEGKTQPDIWIETPEILIVIEGKRTEAEATKKTKWMPVRHQMLRHMDCAWEIKGSKQLIGFFIVEGNGRDPDVPPFWLDQAPITMSPEAIKSSLPHRGPEEQKAIARCFIGVATWQQLCVEFGIEWNSLPNFIHK